MIRKEGSGFRVVSESGKNLSKVYKTRDAAEARLAQVEMFKAMDAKKKARNKGTQKERKRNAKGT